MIIFQAVSLDDISSRFLHYGVHDVVATFQRWLAYTVESINPTIRGYFIQHYFTYVALIFELVAFVLAGGHIACRMTEGLFDGHSSLIRASHPAWSVSPW